MRPLRTVATTRTASAMSCHAPVGIGEPIRRHPTRRLSAETALTASASTTAGRVPATAGSPAFFDSMTGKRAAARWQRQGRLKVTPIIPTPLVSDLRWHHNPGLMPEFQVRRELGVDPVVLHHTPVDYIA